MLLKGNNILKAGGRFLTITPDGSIILKFTVRGTCFPAKRTQGNAIQAIYRFTSAPNVDNKIYINYNDGTGEHEYNFKSSGSIRRIDFRNLSNGTTPETIQGSTAFDETIHFYQDLPEGVKNTVQEEYPVFREVTVRFEKPQSINVIYIYYSYVYGVLSSSLAKFKNLTTLDLTNLNFVEAFAQDFYDSNIETLILQNVGAVMDNGIPSWILNSKKLKVLSLSNSVNLSDNPVSKGFSDINQLKDSLVELNLSSTQINYPLPESLCELSKLKILELVNNSSNLLRMPDGISDLISLETLNIRGTRMPFSEVERILSEVTLKYLDVADCNYTSNFDIEDENYTLERIGIGVNTWSSGAVPSFISKLKGLKQLDMAYPSSSSIYSGITGYGDFSECTNIETLWLHRLSNLTTTIPIWFDSLTKLKEITIQASFQNSGGINSYVNNFYDFIVANSSMSVGSTPFRMMTINAYGTNTTDQNNSTRPSGTYQQPSGYVQGSSNGTPASPMEKIWVLSNQYGHTWTVKPA